MLVGLAPHLPPGLLREALATTCIIVEEGTCAEALAGLAPHLPPALLAEALHLLLETCARLPRPEAITQLVHAVTEIGIQRLGGEATVRELVAAIVEVGRRWP